MAIDARSRPQQPSMHFMSEGGVAPQFTNPWVSQEQMHDATVNLHSLSAKTSTIRTSGVPAPYMPNPTSHPSPNSMRNLSPPHYGPSVMAGLGEHPVFTTAEMALPGSTAPSPTTCGATYIPSISTSFDIPRTLVSERRLSHPTMSTPIFLGADMLPKQRQASLTDMAYRPRPDLEFSNAALDSTRGMVIMGQANARSRGDGANYPAGHSASSSISSSHSFPYYNGGSVDSSVTDYSDGGNYHPDPTSLRQPTLPVPRPNNFVAGPGAPVPNQMMTTFSSKITSSTQKKHKCKVCDKRFTRPSSLQTHTYSHTGEKPFVCEHHGCGRRFSVVSNLRRHNKVHQGKNHGS